MTNSPSLQQIWLHYYQLYHLKQPVFRMLADEKIGDNLEKGNTINFRQLPDFYYDTIGSDGTYTAQGYTETNETLTISYYRGVPQRLVQKDLEQQDTQMKTDYAKVAMNRLFVGMDADVLLAACQGAYYGIDATVLSGAAAALTNANINTSVITSTSPITLSPTTMPILFSLGKIILGKANVIYDPNLTFTKGMTLKVPPGMPVAVISWDLFQQLLIFLGGKTTVLGDKVTVSGHEGAFMGFNLYISNNLPSSALVTIATQPTDGDTFTINGFVFTFKTILGSTAGNILIGGSAAAAVTNLQAALAAPFTTTANYVKQTDNAANRLALYGFSASTTTSPYVMMQAGNLIQITAVTFNSSNNSFGTVIQHNIFGMSKSIAMCLQGTPRLDINFVSGALAKDYVTNSYFGLMVYKYQTKQLIDVLVNGANLTPALVTNY
jgi:hypothetical protein